MIINLCMRKFIEIKALADNYLVNTMYDKIMSEVMAAIELNQRSVIVNIFDESPDGIDLNHVGVDLNYVCNMFKQDGWPDDNIIKQYDSDGWERGLKITW